MVLIQEPLPSSVVPRDFDHLITSHWIVGEDGGRDATDAVMYNGIGRSLNSSNTWDLIQPAFISVPFTDDIAADDFNFILIYGLSRFGVFPNHIFGVRTDLLAFFFKVGSPFNPGLRNKDTN